MLSNESASVSNFGLVLVPGISRTVDLTTLDGIGVVVLAIILAIVFLLDIRLLGLLLGLLMLVLLLLLVLVLVLCIGGRRDS